MDTSSLTHHLIRILRYAWPAPCTALGLCLAAPAFLFGARASIADGVIEVALCPRRSSRRLRRLLPFSAITFGHLVIAIGQEDLLGLRLHEHEHVRQYQQWGPLFFLAYPAASLWQLLRGHRPYLDNWFEVRARAKESDGAAACHRGITGPAKKR